MRQLTSSTLFTPEMAVVLERESESTGNTPTKLPKVIVKNAPIQPPSNLKGVITSRTSRTFTSEEQIRKAVWKENYDRRRSQLSECGFSCPSTENYREVGTLLLDDKNLIERGLGQEPTPASASINPVPPIGTTAPIVMPVLRARNPTQFPTQLLRLHSELDRANNQLDQVRLGQGLFHMLHLQDAKTMAEASKQLKQVETEKAQEWRPASIEAAIKDDDFQKTEKDETTLTEDVDTISNVNRQLSILVWVLEAMMHNSITLVPSLAAYLNNKLPTVNINTAQRQNDQRQKLFQKWEVIKRPTLQKDQAALNWKREEATVVLYKQWQKVDKHRMEEELLRKQKRLSPEQFEQLKLVIEDELNYAMKQTRNSLKELMKSQAMENAVSSIELPDIGETSAAVSPPSAFSEVIEKFNHVEEDRGMIVHEQLSVMSRDKQDALRQRFASLRISGNVWRDLAIMRKGVKMETTTMARNKLMMNYDWMLSLFKAVPTTALDNRYCRDRLQRLSKIQDYMCSVGPKVMSKGRLISVLSSLRPWELHSPEIVAAVEFIIRHVIYIVPEDYYKWLEYHTSTHTAMQ